MRSRALLLVTALALTGCGRPADAPTTTDHAAATALPRPDLSALEERTRGRIEAAWEEADRARSEAAPAAEQAAALGRCGMLLQAHDQRQAAAEAYRQAIALDESELRWPFFLAHLQRFAAESEAAATGFLSVAEALAARPQRARPRAAALHWAGRVLLDAGRAEDALARLEQAHSILGDTAPLLASMAQAVEQTDAGDLERVVDLLDRALALRPDAPDLLLQAAAAHGRAGNAARARSLAAAAGSAGGLPLQPADPWFDEVRIVAQAPTVLRQRGDRAFARGDFDAARADYERSIGLDPDDPVTHGNLAAALAKTGDLDGALAEVTEALRLRPDYAPALAIRGIVLAHRGDLRGARAALEACLGISPDQPEALLASARLDAAGGDHTRAVGRLESLLAVSPWHATARSLLARCTALAGQEDHAEEVLRAGLALDPADRTLRCDLARLLAAATDGGVRDPAAALALANRLARQSSGDVETLLALAHALAAAGRQGDARNALGRCAVLAREHGQEVLAPVAERTAATWDADGVKASLWDAEELTSSPPRDR